MTIQTLDPHQFGQKTRRIRAQVSTVLTKWGLLPRFKRWRLTQDPGTGMVVLFGVLNNRYIAAHTSMPFANYFDPRLLQDLANELQMQVVSCNSDGLRYAIILDRGQLGKLPTHIDFPFMDDGKVLVRVVYTDIPPSESIPFADPAVGDERKLVREGVGAFLKIFDDLKLMEDAVQSSAQNQPGIVVIDENEFKKRVAGHEADRQRIKRIRNLFDKATG